jgi:Ca2+-binding RTX toxin-like protein
MIVFVGVLAAVVATAPTAAAQEAPICRKTKEKLDEGRDVFRGTKKKDSVTGLRGNDLMLGKKGRDLINGGRNSDVVKGGPGKDVLCGGSGKDVIKGGPGNDRIYGEEDSDKILPGSGDDKVLGSHGDDKIIGWGQARGPNNEIIYTEDGRDLLSGGHHNDVIEAGGADALYGHNHNDILRTKTPDIAPVVMDGEGNEDTIFGSNLADTIIGGEGRDTLWGSTGNDRILGAGNDDRLFGEAGDDHLDGGDGFDDLNGGAGNDFCDGGVDDLPRDSFDQSCEKIENRPRPMARPGDGAGGAKSRVKITTLNGQVVAGKVRSSKARCERGRVVYVQRAGFISEKVGSTTTDSRGRWEIRKTLLPGQYFAQVDSKKGCRYDTSPRERLSLDK